MQTTAAIDIFESLCSIMQSDPEQLDARSKGDMELLFAYCIDGMDDDSQKLLAVLMMKALNKKIHSEFIGENLYLNKYEISQIQLFDILIHQFPFVKYSQLIVNNAIVELVKQHDTVTLVDVGIGMGTQMAHVVASCKNLKGLKKMHIVGIEPYGDALQKAAETIRAFQGTVPFDITFTAIQDGAENVDFAAIPGIEGAVVVNASLALHHIQSARQRTETIGRIRQLNPAALILIEPNSNHLETDFYKRFVNCYHHFYSIFKVIDRIDIPQNDKNALKLFFGREIEDIIGKDEKDRYEKHEPAVNWIERLHENTFNVNNEYLHSPVESVCGVNIRKHPEGFLGFTFDQETVLAVIYAN